MFEDRAEPIRTMQEQQFSNNMLAGATGLDHRRIADFTKYRALPETSVALIKDTVRKITFVWEVFAPYRIILDSPELLEAAYADARSTKLNRELAAQQQEFADLLKDGPRRFDL